MTEFASHLKHEALVGGVSNAIFNGLIAWLMLRGKPNLVWSGENSFVVDIAATAFLLPLIVALIVIPLQRAKLKKGELPHIRLSSGSMVQKLVDRFPRGVVKSALLFGLAGLMFYFPVTTLSLYAVGIESFTPAAYSLFKGGWAGLMAAVLVVVMVLVALRSPEVETDIN